MRRPQRASPEGAGAVFPFVLDWDYAALDSNNNCRSFTGAC